MKLFKPVLLILLISALNSVAQNRNLSGGIVFDGEPYLAVNPQNPQHLVVAWMGYVFMNRIMIKTRVSFDGGKNWSTSQNTPHVSEGYTSADPSLAFDSNGNIFLCLIDYDPYFSSGAVYVRKSTDGGLIWGDPVVVIDYNSDPGKLPIDRPWISIDRSGGTHNGNVYITTINATGASGPPYHPYFIRSVNNGESFETWRYADTTGWLSGSLVKKPMPAPVVTSEGTFHCIYPSYILSQGLLPKFILASSSDAGMSFSYNTVYASASSVAVSDTSSKKGYLLRSNPSNPQNLAFFNLGNELGDADVYFRESLDGGLTWSQGLRANDDLPGNGRMQDLVWAAFDTDGDLAVTWRDRRNAADTGYAASYEIYGCVKLKNATAFTTNFLLSDTSISFDDILLGNGNDFMCIELFNDTINAAWGDTRNGNLNIWFQRMTLTGDLVSINQLAKEELPGIKIMQLDRNTLVIESNMIRGYVLSAISGQIIMKTENLPGNESEAINISGVPAAIYFLKVETGNGTIIQKIFIN